MLHHFQFFVNMWIRNTGFAQKVPCGRRTVWEAGSLVNLQTQLSAFSPDYTLIFIFISVIWASPGIFEVVSQYASGKKGRVEKETADKEVLDKVE